MMRGLHQYLLAYYEDGTPPPGRSAFGRPGGGTGRLYFAFVGCAPGRSMQAVDFTLKKARIARSSDSGIQMWEPGQFRRRPDTLIVPPHRAGLQTDDGVS